MGAADAAGDGDAEHVLPVAEDGLEHVYEALTVAQGGLDLRPAAKQLVEGGCVKDVRSRAVMQLAIDDIAQGSGSDSVPVQEFLRKICGRISHNDKRHNGPPSNLI